MPSIREMVEFGGRLDYTYAMKEYEIPRFDGKSGDLGKKRLAVSSDWNKEKGRNFIDLETKSKAHVPSPNYYKKVQDGYGFKVSAPFLYKSSRKTEFTEMIDKAKKVVVGPGSHEPKRAQRRVLGTYGGLERVTIAEESTQNSNAVPPPDKYTLPDFVSTIVK